MKKLLIALAAGAAVAALVIGDDGKMLMQEGKDQLRILEGVLGEAVNDDHGCHRILCGIGSAPERPATFTRDLCDGFPGFQPGKDLLIHGPGIVFRGDQIILIESSFQRIHLTVIRGKGSD